ncbi:protein kinase domain containing protein [Nitzschia inconspicua]|uniref:Protein kinase domain containing protein n=1 Tax=Nitzschia inconspicua TaxID=303405 RepID=A0A9K3PJR6_9STRA|nr:protein kinase domain containing protein [Nitzschia inconspicua]
MKDHLFSPSQHHHYHHPQHSTTMTSTTGGGCSDVDVSMDDDGHSVNTVNTVNTSNNNMNQNNNNSNNNNCNNTSVNTSNECMSIASPPRTVMRTVTRRSLTAATTATATSTSTTGGPSLSASVRSQRLRSRLFEEDDDEEEEEDHLVPRFLHRKTSAIKPMSLNLDFDAEAADSDDDENNHKASQKGRSTNTMMSSQNRSHHHALDTSSSLTAPPNHSASISASSIPTKTPHRPSNAVRKRSAEQFDLYTKQCLSFERDDHDNNCDEDVFSAAESPVDMYASPHISPASPPSTGSRSSSSNNNSNNNNNPSRISSMYRSPSCMQKHIRTNVGNSQNLSFHKSPSSFVTLDGRTVQSKNPFSPMIFEEHPTPGSMMDTTTTTTTASSSTHISSARAKMELRSSPSSASNANESLFLNMNDSSLSLPASLTGRTNGTANNGTPGDGPRMLLPRHTLHKRDTNKNMHNPQALSMMEGLTTINPQQQQLQQLPKEDLFFIQQEQEQQHKEFYYTRDGYPERTGRYSFTGSPIKEHLEATVHSERNNNSDTATNNKIPSNVCTNIHKIRRRTKGDDVVAAAAHGEPSWKRHGIYIRTNNHHDDDNNKNNNNFRNDSPDDHISPTDVANFPLFRPTPSDTKTLPPTPSKPVRRPPSKRYTPIRKSTGPPPTPMPVIRRARSFDDDEFGDAPERPGARRHSSGSTMDYLSLSPGGEGGQPHLTAATGPPPSRFYSDFDIISELGNGSFGNVYKVLSRLDGCMYAIKVAHRPAKGMADKDRMLKEVYALAALSDQADTATFHIVRYHQAWMEENRLYIQTELCTTTLQAEMQQASPLALPLARRYKCLREILLALEYIHKNGMVHLDIKPENVFLKNDQFKLGDFGLVSKVSSHDVEEGDSRYMSMELLSGDHADLTKSDIFSLGITMYELCMGGSKPLPSNGPEWQALRSGGVPRLSNTPDELHQIMLAMMHPSYQERPCASELLQRPQLLSDEQKMLMLERNKVLQANLALVAQSRRLEQLAPAPAVPKKGLLARRNTWSFSS